MSAAAALAWVWAVEAPPEPQPLPTPQPIEPQLAFYRKYTEALLRRYVRLSLEAGKVPSLLGQEMFRGKVTSYRIGFFDDVIIFLHDVNRCMERLEDAQRDLIERIALQQFTVDETATLLGLPPRSVIRRYGRAVDALTQLFLEVQMLEPLKSCQEAENSILSATASIERRK
jgi:hypothetical protein